jgi:protein CpxP
MNISKQLAITASFVLLSVFPAISQAQNNAPDAAQGQTQTQPQREDRGAAALANLNLTDDQKAQIKQIHEGARSRVDAVKNDASLPADQKEAKIREIHRDTHQQVEKVLTPDQRKQMKENMRENRAAKQQQPPPSN